VSLGIAAWEWKPLHGDAGQKGLRANVSSFTRHHPNVTMTKAKISGNYVNSVLARTESVRLGFDEAILLDPAGYVAECTGENLFAVRNGRLFTPQRAAILEGITRDSVLAIAQELGYVVTEQDISRDQLYIADELFVCGTAAEVVPLREVDFRTIGAGTIGPITKALQTAYRAAVRGQDPRYESWLTPVPATEARVASHA
jgi:branched-chain amino acid aminotransferase